MSEPCPCMPETCPCKSKTCPCYNCLPTHKDAKARLRRELMAAFCPNSDCDYDDDNACRGCLRRLLTELSPHFRWENGRPKFIVWLRHAHFGLNVNEKMVSSGDIEQVVMQPMHISDSIHPDRWDGNGTVVEHRLHPNNVTSAPPHESSEDFKALVEGFREVMQRRNITVLGISNGPSQNAWDKLQKDGQIFLEETDHRQDNRIHTIIPVNRYPVPFQVETAWVTPSETLVYDETSTDPFAVDGCSHVCHPIDDEL
jgi:hypothetical protein